MEIFWVIGKYQPSFHSIARTTMAVPRPIAYTSVVSNKEHVTNDLLKLPNDVVIILDDGQVEANKDLLSVRSDYFARSFNNPKFLESQSKSITMKGCTEAAMKALVNYIYTGEMDLEELSLPTLLIVMNFSRQILIEHDLYNGIETFLKIRLDKDSFGSFCERMHQWIEWILKTHFEEFLECPLLVESFRLNNLMEPIMRIVTTISVIVHVDAWRMQHYVSIFSDDQRTAARDRLTKVMNLFQKLPIKIVREIVSLKYAEELKELLVDYPLTRLRFELFVAWYSANEADYCAKMEKKVILASFNYMDFTGEELVTVVGRSGMFSREEVDRMLIEKFRENDEEIDHLNNLLNN